MAGDLTDNMLGALFTIAAATGRYAFRGPRPGSNFWPMLEIVLPGADVPGEMM